MGGKNKKVTTGYWWEVAIHDGLCLGPLDAFLEWRPGTKTAWSGRITSSSTININQPNLWGGEKDQGGVSGPLNVMFGEADQLPNAYLTGVFGDQTVAWRGIATVAFEGGRYGANNPWPQKRAYKVERIKQGWDDGCWYPEKAAVPVETNDSTVIISDTMLSAANVSGSSTVPIEYREVAGVSPSAIIRVTIPTGGTYKAWSPWSADDSVTPVPPPVLGYTWGNSFRVTTDTGHQNYLSTDLFRTADEALAGVQSSLPVRLTGSTNYRFWLYDPYPPDDRGGLSLRVEIVDVVFSENPAHAIIWAHTQQHCGAQPLETVNAASAQAAADWFYAQGFGLCTIRYPDKESAGEFIRRIERVAGCAFTQNRADGQWYIDIANGEYDLETLPVLTDDDIVSFEEVPSVLDEAVNSVSVKYFDPQRKEAITTRPVTAMALVAEFGTIHQTYEFPEIPTDALANRIAARELLARCTPTRVFNLVTMKKTASWRRNTYFRLQLPKRGITDMVCLLAEVDAESLKSGAVKIKATQDIYSLPTAVFTETEQGVDTRPPSEPVPVEAQVVFEAPHVDVVAAMSRADFSALPADTGFAVAAAGNPGDMLSFTLYADAGAGYASVAPGDFCPIATLAAELPPQQETAIALASAAGLDAVLIGSACIIGGEWCRVDAIDSVAGTIDLGRGCADTLPAKHDAGTTIYFYSEDAASDPTEYVAGETIDLKLLPRTSSKELAEADATALPLTFSSRLARQYPPAQLQLGGVSIFDIATTSIVGGSAFDEAGP